MFALTTAPSASASSEPSTVGTVTTTMSGVPSHLMVGDSFEPMLTITSTSADSIEVVDVCMGLWNAAQGGFAQTRGISVSWQDPSTGDWVPSSNVDSNGEWTLDRGSGIITIPPYGTGSVRGRITMTGAARRGIEHLDANGVCAYAIIDASGTNVPGVLDYNFPQTTFSYGALNAGPSATPTNQPAYSALAASPVDTPVVTATPPPASTTPAAAPSPPPAPSTEQTSATAEDTTPAAPLPTGSKLAFNAATGGSTGSGMDAVPLTVTAAALLTFAGAAIIIHRKRNDDDPSDGQSD